MGLINVGRQARWRVKWNGEIERLQQLAAEQAQRLAEARSEIEFAALEQQNATLKMALADERTEIERLQQLAAEQAQRLAEARSEIEFAALEQQNATLKMALADAHKQHAEAAKPAPPPIDPDSYIARLKKRIHFLRTELRELKTWYEDESHRNGIMPFTTYGKVMKCLHPDSKASDAERNEACGLLGQWKQAADKSRRRAG